MAEYRFAFSYSRWSLWDKCPAAFKYQHIDRLPVKPSAAMEKGRRVHDELAKYIAGAADARPESARLFTQMVDGLRTAKANNPKAVHVELQFAVDRDLLPVEWFSRNAWFRAAWDVLVEDGGEAKAVDWKTGRPYGSYEDQKQLFALAAFWRDKRLEQITGYWAYLDPGEVHEATFTRDQVVALTDLWRGNASMMEADRAFRPKPSESACRFCDFSWRKGGPCRDGV